MGLNLDVCPQCAGIWFDDGELATLIDTAPDALDTLEEMHLPELEIVTGTGNFRHCPRCNAALETHKYAYDQPAKVDSCPSCHGVFVEDRELGAIHDAVSEKYRSTFTGAMKARQELTGESVTRIGKSAEDVSVSALITALSHWRDKKGVQA